MGTSRKKDAFLCRGTDGKKTTPTACRDYRASELNRLNVGECNIQSMVRSLITSWFTIRVNPTAFGGRTVRRDKYAGPPVSRFLNPCTDEDAAGSVPLVFLLLLFALLLMLLAPTP